MTDLAAEGLIDINKKLVRVTGRAWMDHQWADVAYSRDAWDWFSLQLSDGTDIMAIKYKVGKKQTSRADMIDAQGKSSHHTDLILRPSAQTWESPKTKAHYPLEWEIEIPRAKIKLKVRAAAKEQEMIFGEINYWEGPLTVTGSVGAKKITGFGFMELVGYASDYNFLALAGRELNHKIGKAVLTKIKKIL